MAAKEAKAEGQGGDKRQLPWVPTRQSDDGGHGAEGGHIPVFWFLSMRGKVLSSKELPPWVREALLRFTYSNRQ